MVFKLAFACILLVGIYLTEIGAITFEKSPLQPNQGPRKLIKSACQGGKGGRAFDDITDHDLGLDPILTLHSISISFRSKVDSIKVTYLRNRQDIWGLNLFKAPRHGIMKSRPTTITFENFEHIVRIEGQTDGRYITQLVFITEGSSAGKKVYGPFGKNSSHSFSFDGFIVGLFGRRGVFHLNAIGVYSFQDLKKSKTFGGTGGDPFDDYAEVIKPPAPPIIGLAKIRIWSGDAVNGIITTYSEFGYDFFIARQHGLQWGNLTTIDLVNGDVLVALDGLVKDDYISQLSFTIQKPDGSKVKHGPFGRIGGSPFSLSANIVSLYGSSGSQINKIGVFYVD